MMDDLEAFQTQFLQHCYNQKVESDKGLEQAMAEMICTRHLASEQLLSIYADSIVGNVYHTLKLTYPTVLKLVGAPFFEAMATAFIYTYPPHTRNMDDYGAEFSQFIATYRYAEGLPYLADVAQFEWYFHLSCIADEDEHCRWQELSLRSEQEQLNTVFTLSCSCRLMSSEFPVFQIWQMNQQDIEGHEPLNLTMQEQQYYVLNRKGRRVEVVEVERLEYEFLRCIEQRKTLSDTQQVMSSLECKLDQSFELSDALTKFITDTVIVNYL